MNQIASKIQIMIVNAAGLYNSNADQQSSFFKREQFRIFVPKKTVQTLNKSVNEKVNLKITGKINIK